MKTWIMPNWMKPYTKIICPGNTIEYIEEMVNDKSSIKDNIGRLLISMQILGRVQMITSLYERGLLKEYYLTSN